MTTTNSTECTIKDVDGNNCAFLPGKGRNRAAHVRFAEGDDHLRLQLCIRDDRKTFYRSIDERLDKIRHRLQLLAVHASLSEGQNIGKKASNKAKKNKKKNKKSGDNVVQTNGSNNLASVAAGSSCASAATKVTVQFLTAEGEEVNGKFETIGDALMTRVAKIIIGDDTYEVRRNQPVVVKVMVVEPVLAGIPMVPLAETEFCHPDDCTWRWYHVNDNSEGNGEERVDTKPFWNARRYTPTAEQIGCKFRIECYAPSMDLSTAYDEESKVEAITTVVRQGPDRQIFHERKRFGLSRASEDGSAFRIMNYNILFDGYTTTDQAQKSLFPYAQAYALQKMYRMQLVFQEMDESQSDIICLQEMGEASYKTFFAPLMTPLGYHASYAGKTGSTHEGCAIFVRKALFEVVEEYTLDLAMAVKYCPDSTVSAVLAEFPEVAKGFDKIPSIAQVMLLRCHHDPQKLVLLSNTHLFYREDADMIRLLQAVALVQEIRKIREKTGGNTAVIMCGDFNAFPGTATTNFLLHGTIDSNHRHWQEVPWFKWNRSYNNQSSDNKKSHVITPRYFEHPLQLASACGIPAFTNFAGTFVGTLDYIFVNTEHLRVREVLPLFTEEDVSEETALPSSKFPSDHISLLCDLEWS